MNKIYLLAMAAALAVGGSSCNSDDPRDATEKHVYGEGENPYLRTNNAATNQLAFEFPMAKIDTPQYINLKEYADCFHKNLNMTVDEALTALQNGEAGFITINTSRQVWRADVENSIDYLYHYGKNGLVDTAEDECFQVSLDPITKMVKLQAVNTPAVGTIASLDFGIALKNGSNLDDYVRFNVTATVTDPSKVVLSAIVPAGGYNAYEIDFRDYPDAFRLSMGMDVNDAIKAMDNDLIDVYLVDADGNRVVDEDGNRPDYTSGWLGYWLDSDLNITWWSGDGYPANLMFLEYWGDGIYALGNSATSTPSGTQTNLVFDLVPVDNPENFVQFVIQVTFE